MLNPLTKDQVIQLRTAWCGDRADFETLAKELGLTFKYAVNVARGRRYTSIPIDRKAPGYKDSLDPPALPLKKDLPEEGEDLVQLPDSHQ